MATLVTGIEPTEQTRALSPLALMQLSTAAAILVGIGELDEAFTLYDLAYQQRSGYFMFLRVFPTREYPIRSDPRFVALLQKLHLNF